MVVLLMCIVFRRVLICGVGLSFFFKCVLVLFMCIVILLFIGILSWLMFWWFNRVVLNFLILVLWRVFSLMNLVSSGCFLGREWWYWSMWVLSRCLVSLCLLLWMFICLVLFFMSCWLVIDFMIFWRLIVVWVICS